jgi:hypothetical protein
MQLFLIISLQEVFMNSKEIDIKNWSTGNMCVIFSLFASNFSVLYAPLVEQQNNS